MSEIIIERAEFDPFMEEFREEAHASFDEFLHCGSSPLYTEEENKRAESLKLNFIRENFICLLAKLNGKVVGRSFSQQTDKRTLFMCMSFVDKKARKQGVYTKILQKTIELAKELGYLKIVSCHNTSNNDIIIPKLKHDFVITGMKVNAGYGTLVELTYFVSQNEKEVQDFRCGYRKPTEKVKEYLNF